VTDQVTFQVGNRYDRIVERRLDMNNTLRNHTTLFPLKRLLLTSFCLCLSHILSKSAEDGVIVTLLLARSFLLGNCLSSWALTSARVSMGALSPNRKPSPVSQTPITPDIHQPLDVHLDLLPQIAFYHSLLVDDVPDTVYFLLRQFADPLVNSDASLPKDLVRP
jgi:hypothetical protein